MSTTTDVAKVTRVISVRGLKRADLEADPDFRYVGRAVRYTTWTQASPWANPFSVSRYGADALKLFEHHMAERIAREPELLARIEAELKGYVLGCWCGNYDGVGEPGFSCHAVVLARLAEGWML